MQMTLRAGPATFGQVQLTVFDRHLHPTAAVEARPGIDHATGRHDQFDQRLDAPEYQPQHRHQGQGCPQARFETEALVSDQHVAGMLGNRQPQSGGSGDDQKHDHIEAFHGVASGRVFAAGLAMGLIESSALTLRRSR
ncbi:hypothetical protein FQZ97_1178450 [compost metagenome]